MADFIQEQGSTASYEGNQYVELAGTSQEAKPTGDFLSGSVFVEVDTGKVFLYDRESSEWHEIAGSGGGGGGGSSGGGLPSYTNDDIGKSLKLADSGETTTETVTTISEQTFVSNGRGEGRVACAPEYPWILGETIHLTVNNEVHDCVVRVLEGRVPDALGISAELAGGGFMEIEWSDGSRSNVLCPAEETFVVSATKEAAVPLAAPAWMPSGVLVVHGTIENTTVTLDKTWREIADADLAVISVSMPGLDGASKLFVYETVHEGENLYSVTAFNTSSSVRFQTHTEDGYPLTVLGG